MNFFAKIKQFFSEVRQELKKVAWPTRQEAIKHTLLVIGVSIGLAIFLGAVDLLFVMVLNRFVI